ncbi:Meiosis-specific serine threonine-protein kinase Mek1 [Lasiodiplodia theobromae]|uniref:Meiosis-specific serine threonine-protein kinase Mek1 n=1 Tax=Lasiodiplodia theobromae TaxID=45133 RepID=UPI0015C2D3A4|nr:Meiosis-specific serine threonine-protein kinase Mek1 [Lasiodiplodia theobromae]KAF4545157.1 Meiosis-specific serine threonine-protein kinase Mek1 [Lasiodiplodia theobromae]
MVESSEPRTGHAGPPVAFLDLRHAANEYDGRDSEGSKLRIPIHSNEEFYFGRDSLESKYDAPPTMSKRHLKFHCILFDNDGQWGIQPLVYAKDISTNGTYLKRTQTLDTVMMRPHAQTTLLEDDDEFGRDMERLAREFEVLRDLDHPNIIKLEKVYHSDAGLYIFQELIPGGDLFSFVTNRYDFGVPTIEAAVIVYQILKGVDYLHENGIVHRDIKPDNILLTSTKTACRVVITDFGQSRYLPEDNAAQRMVTMAGTLGFNAPEIFRRNPKVSGSSGYSKAVDVWSVGCVAGLLLSGKPIFHDNDAEDQGTAVKVLSSKCNLDILENDPVWQKVGRRAKDFIRRTVVLDENDRLDAKQALQHEWFSSQAYADELQAVYQHVTKDWEPRRQIFKIIEHIPTSRPKMFLAENKPAADVLVQQDSNSAKHLDQENHGQQQLIPTQLMTQNHQKEKQNILYDANSPQQRDSLNSAMPGASDEENMQRRLTHLSLSDQQDEVDTDWHGTRQPSFDFDRDMGEDSHSHQQYAMPSSGKRQPSFDFDQDVDDANFWEAAVTAEFKQPIAKRLRTG